MTAAELLLTLRRWRAAGWLRPLDVALADLLHELDPETPASLLLAAALLAHLEGRGHSCLPLAQAAADAASWLGWSAAAAEELAAALPLLPGDETAAQAAWAGSTVLQADPADDCGSTPLVLCQGRLYLRRYWRFETGVAARVRARAAVIDAPSAIDPAAARVLIDQLFGPPDDTLQGPDWQRVACALALRGRLTLLTGGPGTGKTYTAARMLVLMQALHTGPQPLRVALAAPTGKAAARLRLSIDVALQGLRQRLGNAWPLLDQQAAAGPARTLHALLGARPDTRRFVHDAGNPLDVDVLFVDEASMVHLEMMAALLDALPPGARLVLLGDRDQLASVEAGAVLGDLCAAPRAGAYRPATADWVVRTSGQMLPADDIGPGPALAQQTVVLRRSRRFVGPIGQLALAVNRGDAAAAQALLRATPGGAVDLVEAPDAAAVLPLALDGRAGAAGGYRHYLSLVEDRPADAAAFDPWVLAVLARFDTLRVLCAVREGPWGVAGLNTAIERLLAAQGLLPGRGEWYAGRPVMVTRNDASLGVFNGDIGVVLPPPAVPGQPPQALRAWFADGDTLRSVSVSRLADVETAFAMTVHKSQGSEFEHVVLVLPPDDTPVLTRELVYTGITRARQACTLVMPQTAALTRATARLTRRLSGLAPLLVEGAEPPTPGA